MRAHVRAEAEAARAARAAAASAQAAVEQMAADNAVALAQVQFPLARILSGTPRRSPASPALSPVVSVPSPAC